VEGLDGEAREPVGGREHHCMPTNRLAKANEVLDLQPGTDTNHVLAG
jgi:hypothetical protein